MGNHVAQLSKNMSHELQILDKHTDVTPDIQQSVLTGYSEVSQKVAELISKADDILKKDPQLDEVAAEARECRIALMRTRTETERTRKSLLRPIDTYRKAISGAAAIITDEVSRRESKLEQIEQMFEERKKEANRLIHEERLAQLKEIFGDEDMSRYPEDLDLSTKSRREFDEMKAMAISQAEKIRDAREKARLEEEQRQRELEEARQEAARLRAEQEEREAALKAELALREAELDRQKAEMAEQQRILNEKLAEAENARREAEQKAAAEKAEKEREQREALEKKRQEMIEAAAEKLRASVAPDKEKLHAYLNALKAVPAPELTSKSGIALGSKINTSFSNFVTSSTSLVEVLDKFPA
jgi:hypothetical protein